jgi:hypothetical protein
MNTRETDSTAPAPTSMPTVNVVGTHSLETLLGYNARQAALVIIDVFLARMAVYDLRPVDFSVIALITHNPGITSRLPSER